MRKMITRFSADIERALLLGFAIVLLGIFVWDFSKNRDSFRNSLSTIGEQEDSNIQFRLFSPGLNVFKNVDKFIEDDLVKGSVIRKSLGSHYNSLLGSRLGEISEALYHGTDGWLFYRDATDSVVQMYGFEAARKNQIQAALKEFQDRLTEKGITLVLMPMPSKALIYPEMMNGLVAVDTHKIATEYSRNLNELLGNGFKVFDPLSQIMDFKKKGQAYQPRDSHWTPECMSSVAEKLAGYLSGFKIVEKSDIPIYDHVEKVILGVGDLQRIQDFCSDSTHTDVFKINEVKRNYRNVEKLPKQVLLLGDSFSNIYSEKSMKWGERAGLAEQLSYYLNSGVAKLAVNDNAAYVTREKLSELTKGGDKILSDKKVVIYQFAARELVFGDWKMGYEYSEEETDGQRISSPGFITFKGEVTSFSKVPSLSDIAPYENALVVNRYRINEVIRGDYDSENIYVIEWAIKNGLRVSSPMHSGVSEMPMNVVDVRLVPDVQQHYLSDSFNRTDQPYYFFDEEMIWNDALLENFDSSGELLLNNADVSLSESDWSLKDTQLKMNIEQLQSNILANGGLVDWRSKLEVFRADVLSVLMDPGSKYPGFYLSSNNLLFSGRSRFVIEDDISHGDFGGYSAAVDSIIETQRKLKDRGIDLLLVPVPTRVELNPEEFNPEYQNVFVMPARFQFLEVLNSEGVETIDVLPDLLEQKAKNQEPLSLAYDPHWSQFAVRETAKMISKRLMEYGFYKDLEKTKFKIDESMERPPVALISELRRKGYDVNIQVLDQQIHRVRDYFDKNESIFDPVSPYLFIGDSYLGVYGESGGLCAQVGAQMQLALDQFVRNGGGPIVPKSLKVLSEGGGLKNKRVIIWVFVSRYLGAATAGEWREGRW